MQRDRAPLPIGERVPHNTALEKTSLKLYGINKWANEHGINIVLHIHFDDYGGRRQDEPGEYNGFVIFVPDHQFSNGKASMAIARKIFLRLAKYFPVSNAPREDSGVTEDSELIATGSNNSLDPASLLIEYGYIYEPQFNRPALRESVVRELAFQTYIGLKSFFEEATSTPYDTTLLPHRWQANIGPAVVNRDVFAVQTALALESFYPPDGISKNDCPPSGIYGPCTERAVQLFQGKYDITPRNGYVGERTRAKLNKLYGK